MKQIPTWAKILAAVLLTAVLLGGTRLLLWLDQLGSAKVGLD